MVKQWVGNAARRVLPDAIYSQCCRSYDQFHAGLQFLSCLGVGRQCPFCNHRFRRFLADPGEPSPLFSQVQVIGGGPFHDAICPFCRSFERERHVYLYLKLMTRIFIDPIRLLHVAPERNLAPILANQKNIQYTSGDLAPNRGQIRIDLTAIDLPNESFDVIICNHVLEHIPQDRQAMSEILRVLRPGGWAILQVPLAPGILTREDSTVVDPRDRLRLYGQHDHVRLYGRDYPQRLESIGFRVAASSIKPTHGDFNPARFGLLPDELIYVATKPG
jgi:SAM-dependent methyltransferase